MLQPTAAAPAQTGEKQAPAPSNAELHALAVRAHAAYVAYYHDDDCTDEIMIAFAEAEEALALALALSARVLVGETSDGLVLRRAGHPSYCVTFERIGDKATVATVTRIVRAEVAR